MPLNPVLDGPSGDEVRRATVALWTLGVACQAPPTQAPAQAGTASATSEVKAPDIASNTEEGFQDFVFEISDKKRMPDGAQLLVASGQYKGEAVGVAFELSPSWKAGSGALGLTSYQGMIGVRSLGPTSDHLLQAMDSLYGTHMAPTGMQPFTQFIGISLQGSPTALEAGMVKIKLFFDSEDEERSAELFLNIDLPSSRVFLSEKDPEYRKAVIGSLSVTHPKSDRSHK